MPYLAQMEQLFGESFGDVQAYSNRSQLAAVNVRGAARGNKIAFASAEPDAGLVAHELAHVVQQRRAGNPSLAAKATVSRSGDAAEREADAIADRVDTQGFGGTPVHVTATPAAALHFDRGTSSSRRSARTASSTTLAGDLGSARRSYWQVMLNTARYLQAVTAVVPVMVRAYGGVVLAQFSLLRTSLADAKAKLGAATAAEKAAYTKLRQRLRKLERDLPRKLGPHMFDGALVAGAAPRFSRQSIEAELHKSVHETAALLRSIRVAEQILRGGFTDTNARKAVDALQAAGNTPAKMRFLDLALRKVGYAKFLYGIPGSPIRGKRRGQTLQTSASAAQDVLGGTPRTVQGVFTRLDKARAHFIADPPDYKRCAYLLQQAHDAIRHFTSGKNARRLPSTGPLAQMTKGASSVTGHLLHLAREGKRGGPDRAHVWDFHVRQLQVFREGLEVMAGEVPYAGSGLAKVSGLRRKVALGVAAGLAAPTVGALLADVAVSAPYLAVMAQRLGARGAGVWPAIKLWVTKDPAAAGAVASLVASIGIDIVEVGGIDNYLRLLGTKEGSLMLAMDIVTTKMSMGAGAKGTHTPARARAPKPRKPPTPGLRAQKEALVKQALDRLAAAKASIIKIYHEIVPQPHGAAVGGVSMPIPDRPDLHNHESRRLRKRGKRAMGERAPKVDAVHPTTRARENEIAAARRANMTEKAAAAAFRIAKKHNVIIKVRNANPMTPYWRKRGHSPKPQSLKMKTINSIDVKYLGANPKNLGLVGYFKPKRPNLKSLAKKDPALAEKVESRLLQRRAEQRNLKNDVRRMTAAGEIQVRDGVVIDTAKNSPGRGKAFAGDYDILAIKTANGSEPSPKKKATVLAELQADPDFAAQHGALVDWPTTNPKDAEVKRSMLDDHKRGGKDSATSFRPTGDVGDAYVGGKIGGKK